jgi:isocitrate dehydrogenase
VNDAAIPVTLIEGDGIGPEVTAATRRVIDAVGVAIDWEVCEAGAKVFRAGDRTGVPEETLASISRTHVALKGPLETPVGFGEKSANVTLRKYFETFANIRPAVEMPGIHTPFTGRGIDLVVVRENIEDLYAGIEHMRTPEVAVALKLVTRVGCEKAVRMAFEFARSTRRSTIHCATKANILKLTEGMMKRVFEEVAEEYPDIEAHHIIVDNCAHQLVINPEQFDVIVTTNMNGDILSDLTSGLVGGLGVAPSANIGGQVAIFEAVHGSAPQIAGQDKANPTAMLLSAGMMLRHIGREHAARCIEQAVLLTMQNGINLTGDIVGNARGASPTAFTDTVIENLQRIPVEPEDENPPPSLASNLSRTRPRPPREHVLQVVGTDIVVRYNGSAHDLGTSMDELVEGTPWKLKLVSNRGMEVYPNEGASAELVDGWRCRFVPRDPEVTVHDDSVLDLVRTIGSRHAWVDVEKLRMIDGEAGFSRAQGED